MCWPCYSDRICSICSVFNCSVFLTSAENPLDLKRVQSRFLRLCEFDLISSLQRPHLRRLQRSCQDLHFSPSSGLRQIYAGRFPGASDRDEDKAGADYGWMDERTDGRTDGRTEPTVWSCTAINTWTTARSIVPNVEDTEGEVSVTLVKCSLSRGSFTRVELDFQTNVGIIFLYFTWPYFEFRLLIIFNLFFFF